MLKKLILAGVIAAAAFAAPASAAVIFSDDFNGENGGTGVLNYGTSTGSFANWTVTQGSVDLIGNGYFDFYPGNGLYVDMDGSTGQSGGITTNATFGAGSYLLTFDLGGSTRGETNTVIVQFDGNTIGSFTLNSGDPLTAESISFSSATGGKLAFIQTNPGDNMGLILDNVQLSTAAVPEPMTLSLFGAGLAAISLRRRKKA